MQQQPGQGPQFNLDALLAKIGVTINRLLHRFGARGSGAIAFILVAAALVVWLATGIYSVGPSERAALRLFGKYDITVDSGLHWYWPEPIGKRVIYPVRETRRMELGFITRGNQQAIDVPAEALMITGDLNIVDIQLVIQYRIIDLRKFLFEVDDPGDQLRDLPPGRPEATTLKEATEAALRQVVGQRAIDDVLTVGREEVQDQTHQLLQQILDDYDTGIQVLEVRLQSVRPPNQVRDAFDDVVRARVDQESIINQANSYKEEQIPRAMGQEAQIVQAAEAFKSESIARAEGEAQRFLVVLKEYENSREVTRQRLYLEAMEEILPGVRKFVIDPDSSGGLLQLLDLGDLSKQRVSLAGEEEGGQ